MRNPQRQLYVTFGVGVAFLLIGCGQGADTAPAVRSQQPTVTTVASASPKCQRFVKVTEDNDPHLDLEERFRISGPTQDGDYRLRPVGSGHQVLPKDHPLVKANLAGDKFEGEVEIQGSGHGQVTLHFYEIDAELDSDGCPSKLMLETMQHAGDPVIGVHGGDAVME